MGSDSKPQRTALAALTGALVAAGANVLFIRYVGEWLVFSGGACLALAAGVCVAVLIGQARTRSLLGNILLVLTLINFNAWAFSHVANLFFYLGLFFFMLFALILGSTLFRFLSALRSVSRRFVNICGVLCVLVPWSGALMLEASYLPQDVYKKCLQSPRLKRLPSGVTPEQLKKEIPDQARRFLRDNYGPNSTLSYLRWGLTSGEMEISIDGIDQPLPYHRGQRGIGFGIRLAASLVLVFYGVFSQIGALKNTTQRVRPGQAADTGHAPVEAEPHATALEAADS